MKPDACAERSGMPLMLASVFFFAANSLLLRAASLHAPGATGWIPLIYRGFVGLMLVFALYGFGRGLSPRAFFGSGLVALRGILGALSTAAFYFSIAHLGAARAVVLGHTYPIFATIIAAWWLKERVSRAAVLWMAAGLGGLALFAGGDAARPFSGWDLVALSGAVASGGVIALIRRLGHREHYGTIYGSLCFYCMVLGGPFIPFESTFPDIRGHSILSLAALVVGFAQLLMTRAYRTMVVSKGTSVQMVLPMVTGVGAWWLFDERFTLVELLGAGLTLVSTWRITARK